MFIKIALATLGIFLAACNGAPEAAKSTETETVEPSKFTDVSDELMCRRDDYDPESF